MKRQLQFYTPEQLAEISSVISNDKSITGELKKIAKKQGRSIGAVVGQYYKMKNSKKPITHNFPVVERIARIPKVDNLTKVSFTNYSKVEIENGTITIYLR